MENFGFQEYELTNKADLSPPSPKEDTDDAQHWMITKDERRFFLKFLPVLCFTVMLNCSIMGSNILFPQYLLDRFQKERHFSVGNTSMNPCHVNQSDPAYQIYMEIQQDSSNFLARASFSGGLPNLGSVVILGALSDKLGRKRIMYFSYAGLVVLSVGLSFLIFLDLPLWMYYILTFVNGICGSSGAMFAAIYAHVADVTTKRLRPLTIGLVEFSFGLSAMIISVSLGALIQSLGFRAPMIGLSVLCVLSILFVIHVKESAPGTRYSMSTCQVIRAPFTSMKMLLSLSQRRSAAIILLAVAFMLHELNFSNGDGVITLYLMGTPFCWDSFMFGVFKAIQVVFLTIFCFIIITFLRYRINNDNLILSGMVSFTASSLVTAIASGLSKPVCDIFMIITVLIGALATIPVIFCRSQASTLVTSDEQGAIFGLMSIGETFATSFGPTISSTLYGATVAFLPGMVFYFTTFVVFIAAICIVIYKVVSAPLRLYLNSLKVNE